MALKPLSKFGSDNKEKVNPKEIFKSQEVGDQELKEKAFEAPKEKPDLGSSLEITPAKRPLAVPVEPDSPVNNALGGKSENLLRIEAILEEDLAEAYFKMDQTKQKKFKMEGEKVSLKIDQLLQKTKDEAKNIFKLIIKWLKMIPGSNKFFVEQEAKIKTDKILKLKK